MTPEANYTRRNESIGELKKPLLIRALEDEKLGEILQKANETLGRILIAGVAEAPACVAPAPVRWRCSSPPTLVIGAPLCAAGVGGV